MTRFQCHIKHAEENNDAVQCLYVVINQRWRPLTLRPAIYPPTVKVIVYAIGDRYQPAVKKCIAQKCIAQK